MLRAQGQVTAMDDVVRACADMFRRHRVEAFGGAFHVPAAREYGCLFAWDSGYHALALRHIDRAAAHEELRALYAANTTEEGLLAHERPLPGSDERTKRVTSWFGPIYRQDGLSYLIDPPVAAYAAARLSDGAQDAALLDAAEKHLGAVERTRTLEDSALPVILHPLESGTDASPLFDSFVDPSSRRALAASHRALAEKLAATGWSAGDALGGGHPFIFADPTFCGWHLLALEALADARRARGEKVRALQLEARARALSEAMIAQLWSEELKLFAGFDCMAGARVEVATLSGIVAAASRAMREAGIAAKVASHHLDPARSRFCGSKGISFNPLDGRELGPKALLWRGDCVWGATQYWAHLVLSRLGHFREASAARLQMEALIAREGFREYYDANTGKGCGAGESDGFTWPALVLEMVAEEATPVLRKN
jgi:hypothetical protein